MNTEVGLKSFMVRNNNSYLVELAVLLGQYERCMMLGSRSTQAPRKRKKAVADSNFFGNVAHNRKDNRIEDTVIIISIEDEAYQTLDWSLGGFRIGGYLGNIHGNTEFLVNGIGPDLQTIFAVRVDCKAIRITDGQLSASFIEIDSDVYDILEALMLRREKPLEKLKKRLSYSSLSDRFLDLADENIRKIYDSFWKLDAAKGDRKEELLRVYQEVHKLRDQSENFGYDLMTAISDELCRFIEKLDEAEPKEVEAIKLHIRALKLVITKNIKGSGGDVGEEMLAGLRQVCDKLHV